jgi:adenylyl-sulfate kinase
LVIWLTGLPAAGKTTIAVELERMLFDVGRHVYRIDGDELRLDLCAKLGYSTADRAENVRRAAALAAHFADAGLICIAALISPLRIDRESARRVVAPNQFIEVYVATSIETCRSRDPKGLYAKAARGEIAEFTGVSAPYEPPLCPEVVVPTEQCEPSQCASQILAYIQAR